MYTYNTYTCMYLPHLRALVIILTYGGSDGKASACSVGAPGWIPGLGRSPGEGNGNPFQYSYLENPRGQRSLAEYSP